MTTLSAFRVGAEPVAAPAPKKRPRTATAPWRPLSVDSLALGTVLGWDQSIRNTAWCLLARDATGCQVVDTGMCRTRAEKGAITWPDRLADQTSVFVQAREVLRRLVALYPDLKVAHEAPPRGGGMVRDPSSSILAAAAVWNACEAVGIQPTLMTPQAGKLLLTGERGAEKKRVAEVVRDLNWLPGRELLTNYDKCDAAVVALKYLEEHR